MSGKKCDGNSQEDYTAFNDGIIEAASETLADDRTTPTDTTSTKHKKISIKL